MQHTQFEKLADVLLRGGIAPRHVSRYVRELEDHYTDLEREARASGKSATEAEREALARVGSVDELAKAMLGRDDLKSVAAKYPGIVFGLLPTATLVASVVAATLLLGAALGLFHAKDAPHPIIPDWAGTVGQAWTVLTNYILPVVIGALVATFGVRQRMTECVGHGGCSSHLFHRWISYHEPDLAHGFWRPR